MIFKFAKNKPDESLSLIKMSFGKNLLFISEQSIISNNHATIINITKRKIFTSLKLIYEINQDIGKSDTFVGKNFRLNYCSQCKIIHNNKEYHFLEELFGFAKNNEIKVKLALSNSNLNLKSLFEDCKTLKSISGYIFLNSNKIYDVSKMFSGCTLLDTLSNISIYNLNKVNNLHKMFYNCKYIEYIFDISGLDTSNVKDMSYLFSGCIFLKSLPDISNWNTKNVKNISHLFERCLTLKYLPDISK